MDSGNGPLILARGIARGFGGHQVLRDVSLDLEAGQVVVVRGENGSGKTTLLNILTGNLSPDAGELQVSINASRDRFSWPSRWWRQMNPFDHFTPERLARAGIGRVWQDIRLFGTFSVLDNVTIASQNRAGENPLSPLILGRRVRAREAENRALATRHLTDLGLGERLESSCDMLSLGQMKRAAIARVVQAGARVIMLDEPLAGLDEAGRTEVLRYLEELAGSGRFTIVIVEHVFNQARVLELATDVWTLQDGGLECRSPETALREIAGRHWEVPGLLADLEESVPGDPGTAALEVEGLAARRGHRRVLEDLSLCIRKGQIDILAKPNAWGKTTLLDAIAGLVPIEAGRILVDGREISRLRPFERSRVGVSYLRSGRSVVPGLTVGEHLALARGRETIASTFPEWRDLLPAMGKRASLLSGGEKQRLALGCLPLGSVLLLDEPFLNLDQTAIEVLVAILTKVDRAVLIAIPSAGGGDASQELPEN